jgi:hypothetical protein
LKLNIPKPEAGASMDKERLKLTAAKESLSCLGVAIETLPGEYRINYKNGATETSQFAESFPEAIDLAATMAAERPLQPRPAPQPPRARRSSAVITAVGRPPAPKGRAHQGESASRAFVEFVVFV